MIRKDQSHDLTINSRKALLERMRNRNLFWSYKPDSIDNATDSETIQTVMLYGDLDELAALLTLYPVSQLKGEWSKLFSRNNLFRREGMFVASYLFGEKVQL